MILKNDEELDLSLHLKVDYFDYVIYVTMDKMRCFKCGEMGHLICACPGKTKKKTARRTMLTLASLLRRDRQTLPRKW